MKTRLYNISKTKNATNFTKTILEGSYKVLPSTFSLFIFIKRQNHCNMPFDDAYKMCWCQMF